MLYEPETHIRPLARSFALDHDSPKGAVLILHGLADSPYSVRDLARFIHAAGFTVLAPRLAGHGSRVDHLSQARLTDWLSDARRALAALARTTPHVTVLGRSFGGVLASLIAAEQPDAARALILTATPSTIIHRRTAETLVRILRPFKRQFTKPWLRPDDLIERLEIGRYAGYPLATLQEFFRSLRLLADGRLGSIRIPTLIVQGEKDSLVPSSCASYFHDCIGSTVKELLFLPEASHDAASLHNNPEFQNRLLAFLNAYGTVDAKR